MLLKIEIINNFFTFRFVCYVFLHCIIASSVAILIFWRKYYLNMNNMAHIIFFLLLPFNDAIQINHLDKCELRVKKSYLFLNFFFQLSFFRSPLCKYIEVYILATFCITSKIQTNLYRYINYARISKDLLWFYCLDFLFVLQKSILLWVMVCPKNIW